MARALVERRIDWTGIFFAVVLTLVIVFPLLVVGTWAFTNVWRYPSVIPQEFGLKFWYQTLARADVTRRFDRLVGDIAQPRQQDQHGQRNIVPHEADNRSPGSQIG